MPSDMPSDVSRAVSLASTLHDPGGRMMAQLQQTLPLLTQLFPYMAINATPETSADLLRILADAGAAIEQQERTAQDGMLQLGAVRRGVVAAALAGNTSHLLYCDCDRMLHWADRFPQELREIVAAIPEYDFTVLGRTPRAFETHPRIQRETERIINHVFALASGHEWDIGAAARGMSRAVAHSIVHNCPEETVGTDAAWPLHVQQVGRFGMVHVETEGLEFETPDRYVDEIQRAGGLAAWMAELDTNPRQWGVRLRLAQLEVEAMAPYATADSAAVPADNSLVGLSAQKATGVRAARPIEIVCHRGANQYAPENTYPAAQLCLDWGMDYVEIDVNTSQDGVLYLMHGPDVARTTDGTGLFHELTSAEIDALDAGSWFDPQYAGERIPRLDEFLAWFRGKGKLFLDVKWAEPQRVLDLLRTHGMENDCFFWSGSTDWLRQLRALDENVAIKINVRTPEEVIAAHESVGATIVETGLEDVTDALLQTCRALGIKLMVYVKENDPDAFRRVLDWGADMINLNHGDAFARIAADWMADRTHA